MTFHLRVLGCAFVLAVAVVQRAAALDITACGQSVPPYTSATLTTDLACDDSASAVFVGEKGKLDFDGHSISGGGIFCEASCALTGPGTIENVMPARPFGGASAVFTARWYAKLAVKDLAILGSKNGIYSNASRVSLKNVVVSNNVDNGITVFGKIVGRNVTTNDNGGVGVAAYNDTASVKMVGLTANGNGFGGLNCQGARTVLSRSTLTANSYPPFPDMPTAIDLVTATLPRLVETSCDHSWGPDGQPWGICSGD